MVTLRLDSARLAASPLKQMTRSEPKARPEPMATTIRKTPVLSAIDARKSPATSSRVVFPFIILCAFPFGVITFYERMLTPASDKTGNRGGTGLKGLGVGP
ncbi:MAG: hypothetical protein A2V52_02825 [Actinobacteria bacterium RBG_19FT_COMBO_54_7]|uniref:Uncharacterized protein n=1 Tax=Candidatus Solincola sediminis TaxID=1797199 RepID=A0A1F2WJ02_9ACTN|nr:MAG: hypothetical protein A2Y75_06590 [Candidatus Solincola sediminis]OFW61068.1 MAG: hypothetical protein A2W01_07410 [Candidatus Solincola sediminis]OFW67833.1 MAG: hypothetical protein A2V52_02825 [Actinobacteria bacterium RBG_19FT_COMBO_54_7]